MQSGQQGTASTSGNGYHPFGSLVDNLTLGLKSRSHLLEIDPHPSKLLNGGPYDELAASIYDVYMNKSQKPQTYRDKIELWRKLCFTLDKYFKDFLLYSYLFIVGSTMSGFGLDSSDIDMCFRVSTIGDRREHSTKYLVLIKTYVASHNDFVDLQLIMARVPILKFRDESNGFEVDLNCNNDIGIRNTHLLYCYTRCDWRVRPLVIMVKIWAQANDIKDAKNSTISSYSWTLMVINYLQCGVSPAVVPCLHSSYPNIFNQWREIKDVHEDVPGLQNLLCTNDTSLAELLIGFFHYYSGFDFTKFAISVRAGCSIPIEICRLNQAPKNDHNQWMYLCIEEPFEYTNTGRSVFREDIFLRIKNIITRSHLVLERTKVLNSILPVVLGE